MTEEEMESKRDALAADLLVMLCDNLTGDAGVELARHTLEQVLELNAQLCGCTIQPPPERPSKLHQVVVLEPISERLEVWEEPPPDLREPPPPPPEEPTHTPARRVRLDPRGDSNPFAARRRS